MKRVGVIGVGNMGSKYSTLIIDNKIKGLELAAVTRIKAEYAELAEKCKAKSIPVYENADRLFEAVENNELKLDVIIIATPHYSHEEIALRAFKNNMDVLCDKPSGVYLRQANNMNKKAIESGKCFAMVFNQRTNPLYRRVKEIVESKVYGELKRVNWIVTDWYRPNKYYTLATWRGTWKTDGGGLLLNQCPHNLDLLQWICGIPARVQGFCHNGRFHDINVEDDVTAYFEWENGANGTFITSTGDAPGINRLEITLDEAMLVCENGELKIGELYPEIGMTEERYRKESDDYFRKLKGAWKTEPVLPAPEAYKTVLQNFSDAINEGKSLIASGTEGRNSLVISNAVYISSWEHRMVTIPAQGSEEEEEFQRIFEEHLEKLVAEEG